MRDIKVKVHPSKSNLKKEDQLAWKIAEIASDKAKIDNKELKYYNKLLITHQLLLHHLTEDQLLQQELWL